MSELAGHLQGSPHLTQYARVREAGALVFFAGVSSRQSDDSVRGASVGADGEIVFDIDAQTEGAIANLRGALESVGLGLADLVDVTCLLSSMQHYAAFNAAWNRHFTSGDGPTRTTFGAELPDPKLAVELKAIAARRTQEPARAGQPS